MDPGLVALIDRQGPDRVVPGGLPVLRVEASQRGCRTSGRRLPLHAAPRARERVRAANGHPVRRPPRRGEVHSRVLPLDVVGVLDDIEVEDLSQLVGNLAAGRVGACGIEVPELAVDAIHADQGAGAQTPGHPGGDLVRPGRPEVGGDALVHTGQRGADRRPGSSAAGLEPVEEDAQGILRAHEVLRARVDVDRRTQVLEVELRGPAGTRPRVGDRVHHRRDVCGVAAVEDPVPVSAEVVGQPQPRAEPRIPHVGHARRVHPVVLVVPHAEVGGRTVGHPPLIVEEHGVRLEVGPLRGVQNRVVPDKGAARRVVPDGVDDPLPEEGRGADDAVAAAALMAVRHDLVGESVVARHDRVSAQPRAGEEV